MLSDTSYCQLNGVFVQYINDYVVNICRDLLAGLSALVKGL